MQNLKSGSIEYFSSIPVLRKTNLSLISILLLLLCFGFIEETCSHLLTGTISAHPIFVKILFVTFTIIISINVYKIDGIGYITYLIFLGFLLKLISESIVLFGNILIYPGVVSVFFPLIIFSFVLWQLHNIKIDVLHVLSNYFLVIYCICMIIYGSNFNFSVNDLPDLNNGPFAGDSRVLHAKVILLITIPLLYYVDKLLQQTNIKSAIFAFISFLVIILHQHRSVWTTATISLVIYFALSKRNGYLKQKSILAIFRIVFCLAVLGIFIFQILVAENNDILVHFNERLLDVFNPTREGSTGSFRVEQTLLYTNLFFERPILGWSFEGFEIENPYVDWWEKGTGHHFHGDFIEVLFYHGIVGFLAKYFVIVFIAIKVFKTKLTHNSIVISSFCLSGIIFAFNYTLPLIYWALCALCVFYIQNDERRSRMLKQN